MKHKGSSPLASLLNKLALGRLNLHKNLRKRSKQFALILSSLAFILAASYNACSPVGFKGAVVASGVGKFGSTGSIVINKGFQFTPIKEVMLSLTSPDAKEMYITNKSDCSEGGSWELFQTQRSWVLASANKQVSVYAKFRSAELEESPCVNASILHDSLPPTMIIDTPAPAISNLQTISTQFHAEDSGTGVAELLCIPPGQKAAVTCNSLYQVSSLADGAYSLGVAATDKAGNTSSPLPQTFVVDRTPPSVVINSHPAEFSGTQTASFTFSGTDNLSGVAGYRCKVDTQPDFATCQSGLSLTTLANGPHRFAVQAVDTAGNISPTAEFAWTVDLAAPSIQYVQTPPAVGNSPTATFGFIGTESDGTPIVKFECRLDSAAYAACQSPVELVGLSEGIHDFEIRGVNRAGIKSSGLPYRWTIDVTAPTVNVTGGPGALINSNEATLTFQAIDRLSGVAATLCSLDGAAFTPCATGSLASYINLPGNQEHSFQMQAKDAAGNLATSSPYKWYIDNTPPTVDITKTPSAISNDSIGRFEISGVDDHSPSVTFLCQFDAETVFAACSNSPIFPNLTEGSHTLRVRTRDSAGNLSPVKVFTWLVDTTGPEIQFTKTPAATILTTEAGQLTYAITDPLSVVKSVVCTLDGQALQCPNLASATITFPTTLAAGAHIFSIVATNEAGVSSTKSFDFMVRDPVCTSQLATTEVLTKMLFVIDMSGSNELKPGCAIGENCTDPGKKMRAGSLQAFFNDYGPRANFKWAFNIFQGSSSTALINNGKPSEPVFALASDMQSAINNFKTKTDEDYTPYLKAIDLATTAISLDPDLNSSKNPQYIVVFMSDGQPTDASKNTIVTAVKKLAHRGI